MESNSRNKEVLRDQNGVELPNFITVTRTFTYDIEMLLENLKEDFEVWDEETIFDLVNEWVKEDLSTPVSRHDISKTYIYNDKEVTE